MRLPWRKQKANVEPEIGMAPRLQALASGEVTMVGTVSATLPELTVVAVAVIPEGTARWAAPPKEAK